jgi:hypothetical protein
LRLRTVQPASPECSANRVAQFDLGTCSCNMQNGAGLQEKINCKVRWRSLAKVSA